jgi:protein O-mannosyl-transferase
MSQRKKKTSRLYTSQARSKFSLASALPFSLPAGAALIVLAVLLVYLPALSGGFIWDDEQLVANNHLLKSPHGLYGLWCTTEPPDFWPLSYTSFWMERRLWGMNSTGYHVSNLALHIVESLLIWIILRKLSIPGAFLAALIFAVHPVNVESVAWIAQRKNTMAMLFFLLSILWYLKAGMPTASVGMAPARSHGGPREQGKTFSSFILHPSSFHFWYWLSLLAFVLAMLGKGSAAVLPVLLLAIVWWLRPLTRRDLAQSVPFFLIAAALTGVNMYFQAYVANIGVIRTADFTQRLLGAGAVVWFYLYKALLPINLVLIYPQWHIETAYWLWWLPLLAAFALTAVLWRYRKGWARPVLFAWVFFCLALAPVMGFTDVGFMRISLVSDHYLHIALIGVIALAAALSSVWRRRARGAAHAAAVATVVLGVCALAFLAFRQSRLYRDPVTMYRAILDKNPQCWVACDNLGEKLLDSGQTQEAIILLNQALRIKPDFDDAHRNLGNALVKMRQLPEAIDHFKQAIRFGSDKAQAYNDYGSALVKAGRPQQAIEQYNKALRIEPNYINVYHNLALLYAGMRQSDDAISAARKAQDIAQSDGQTALARQIEEWIKSYCARLSDLPPGPPDSK